MAIATPILRGSAFAGAFVAGALFCFCSPLPEAASDAGAQAPLPEAARDAGAQAPLPEAASDADVQAHVTDGGGNSEDPASTPEGSVDAPVATPDAGASRSQGSIFEQTEPWTKDVSTLSKASRSDAIVSALARSGGFGSGDALAIDFSIPLFVADASTPRQTVVGQVGSTYCYGGPDCDPVPIAVPMPSNGNAEVHSLRVNVTAGGGA